MNTPQRGVKRKLGNSTAARRTHRTGKDTTAEALNTNQDGKKKKDKEQKDNHITRKKDNGNRDTMNPDTKMKRGKTAYMIFLDVQKAYDKAWLDAILYALYRNGVGKKNLEIIRKLNTGLTAQIQTKYGLTRKITIRDSIRQGGVLSVIEYATLMDEITKEISKNDMGLELRNGEKLRDLLWMDDVLMIHENAKEVQKMLDVTNHIALKKHIEFGAPKCKIVKIGRGPKTQIILNGVILEEVPAYKYLGNMINSKGNLEAQIETLKGKIHAAT